MANSPMHPLLLGLAACVGALACAGDEPSASTAATLSDSGSGDSSTGTSTGDGDMPHCEIHGAYCGDAGLCICTSDFIDDCGCESPWCAVNSCEPGQACAIEPDDPFGSVPHCLPGDCEGEHILGFFLTGDASVDAFAGQVCALGVSIYASAWTEVPPLPSLRLVANDLEIYANAQLTSLAGLASLEEVEAELQIHDNPVLTSLDGLAGLQRVGGGVIRDNPALPTADIEAWLLTVQGGELVLVCGNLDGVPC